MCWELTTAYLQRSRRSTTVDVRNPDKEQDREGTSLTPSARAAVLVRLLMRTAWTTSMMLTTVLVLGMSVAFAMVRGRLHVRLAIIDGIAIVKAISLTPRVSGGPCVADADMDGICDDIDPCVGALDACGICNGLGEIYECDVRHPKAIVTAKATSLTPLASAAALVTDVNDGICDDVDGMCWRA